MRKRGSIVIETAIIMSVVLIIITVAITAMNVHKTDITMQAAIEQSCEDMSSIMPFTRLGAEGVNMLVKSEAGEDAANAYNEIEKLSENITAIAGMSPEELVVDGVLGEVMKNDIASNFIARSHSSAHYVPDSILVRLCYDPDKNCIEVVITYNIRTIIGNMSRTNYSVIPFYGIYNSAIEQSSGGADAENGDEVDPWALGNLDRGQYFEEAYGSNLPHLFPVISSFKDGDCGSTVSIDLTKNMYSSDAEIEKRIGSEIDDLAAFNGADVNINGQRVKVASEEIRSRTLTVVIPENTPEDRFQSLIQAIEKRGNDDVTVNVYAYGNSN